MTEEEKEALYTLSVNLIYFAKVCKRASEETNYGRSQNYAKICQLLVQADAEIKQMFEEN